MYSLVKRQAEVEILPLAKSEKLGVISYSPLAAGLLTGKYGVSRRPDRGRLIEHPIYKLRFSEAWMYEIADKLQIHRVHPEKWL
jgi:aryl-alcohol dehydrogenase-like predicted oxidoreductase